MNSSTAHAALCREGEGLPAIRAEAGRQPPGWRSAAQAENRISFSRRAKEKAARAADAQTAFRYPHRPGVTKRRGIFYPLIGSS